MTRQLLQKNDRVSSLAVPQIEYTCVFQVYDICDAWHTNDITDIRKYFCLAFLSTME